MKSQGYCTKNEQGMFEVNWEIHETLFTKLFKRKTKLVFMTKGLHKDNWKIYAGYYQHYLWFDEEGSQIKDLKTLNKINKVLSVMAIKDEYNF